jgi:hypothetical protein
LRGPVRDDFTLVDHAGELVQAAPIAAEVVLECRTGVPLVVLA